MNKINPKYSFGIFVGMKRKTGEVIVMTPAGEDYTRTVKRLPFERRWSDDTLKWVQWAPWHRYKDDPDMDGVVPEGVPVDEGLGEGEGRSAEPNVPGVVIKTRDKIPRDFPITKDF